MKFAEVDSSLAGTKFMTTDQGRKVYDFIIENELKRILELGFAHGKSSCYLGAAAEELGEGARVTTVDRGEAMARQPNIDQLLSRTGLTAWVTPVLAHTSFTWELLRMLESDPQPRFDFIYIDGGHTWDTTGFAFMLVDRLVAPGGWVLFDDLDWTLGRSPSLRNRAWVQRLSAEERDTPQVRKVFELLVRTHQGYDSVYESESWGWARKAQAARMESGGRPTWRRRLRGGLHVK